MEEKDIKNGADTSASASSKPSRKEKKDAQKALHAKVEALENEVAKQKDDYIRLLAEFENYRRRCAQERLDLVTTASEKIILELLPTLDDCSRAMQALSSATDVSAAKEGTELIYSKLLAVLKAKGLKEIEALGKPLDTDFMEAVAQFPVQEEEKKGTVFDVVQKGYMLGDKVIRYAKVVVAQ